MQDSQSAWAQNVTDSNSEASSPKPATTKPTAKPCSQVADAWSKKAIEVTNRATTDESYRKELAKNIR